MHEVLERYAQEFDRCAHWIEASLPYCNGRYDLASIRKACLEGRMQLWPGQRSAIVTEIADYPLKRVCVIGFAGGDIEELRTATGLLIPWAKSKGCDQIDVYGRKGWVRALGMGRIIGTVSSENIA